MSLTSRRSRPAPEANYSRSAANALLALLLLPIGAVLGGCSFTGSQATQGPFEPSAVSRSRISIATPYKLMLRDHDSPKASAIPQSTAMVYIADIGYNVIYGFDTRGKLLITLDRPVSGPEGLFVDGQSNLWVADSYGSNIEVFPKGNSQPSATYDDPKERPNDVTICPNGSVFVANQIGVEAGSGNISVYRPGAKTPSYKLKDPNEVYGGYITCDSKGNIFSTASDGTGDGWVDEFARGKQAGFKRLPLPNASYTGIKVDSAGNLLVGDFSNETVAEFTESGMATGKSVNTIGGGWLDFAISPSGGQILGANFEASIVQAQHFPSGKLGQKYSANFTDISGFAYDPALKQ